MTPRTRIAVVAAVAIAALAPLAAVAARRPAANPGLPGNFLARAAVRLDLTAQQKEEIRAILQSHQAELAAEVRAIRTTRQALWTAIHADTVNESAIRSAATAVGRAEGELAVTRAHIVEEVREVLTDEQEAELEEMLAEIRALLESLAARIQEHADLALSG